MLINRCKMRNKVYRASIRLNTQFTNKITIYRIRYNDRQHKSRINLIKYLKYCYYCSTYAFSNFRRSNTLRRKTSVASWHADSRVSKQKANIAERNFRDKQVSMARREMHLITTRRESDACSPAEFRPKYASRRLGRLSIGFECRGLAHLYRLTRSIQLV